MTKWKPMSDEQSAEFATQIQNLGFANLQEVMDATKTLSVGETIVRDCLDGRRITLLKNAEGGVEFKE